jgi:glycosyltransferase involved in cell wall biosynthesis
MIAEKSNTPLVSVIMPFFNAERFFRESIESVIAQTYPNWELLLL